MDRIAIDPAVQHGKPVVRGTRVPVDIVVGSLAGGMTYAEVETEYGVTLADIQACLTYAANALSEERLFAEAAGLRHLSCVGSGLSRDRSTAR